MSEPVLLVDVDGGVATVTLNRPTTRNALSHELLGALEATMVELAGRDDVGAVILTGADPAFCAGLDLKELSGSDRLLDGGGEARQPSSYPWAPLGKPLIGAVNGVAVTGGLELALNCDFLIASERAMFADTHARVGVMPGWGLTVLLPQRVGFAMARRMSFTGDFVDAPTALRAGLVTEVVAHDDLLPVARRVAATIVSNNRPGVLRIHSIYRRVEAEVTAPQLAVELEESLRWRREGRTAGLADRVPGVMSRGRDQSGRTGR
ncbi:MAG: enoyl-CoA hydratase [Actinomycetota bacterium]|nr:enoyl-CoA hydratase [Actinomycetota bacterium]